MEVPSEKIRLVKRYKEVVVIKERYRNSLRYIKTDTKGKGTK